MSQRSVSYQSSFDSRPSTAKRSFLSNRTTKASNKSNFKQDQNNSSSLSQAEPQVKLSLRPHSAYVPKKRNINFIQKNIQRSKGSRPNSGVDPGVESRLRYNRNYQVTASHTSHQGTLNTVAAHGNCYQHSSSHQRSPEVRGQVGRRS